MFEAYRVAHYEKENWVAYYQKRWLRLLRASVGMVKEAFELSLGQALYGAYLIARAEIAAAPFPDNDIPWAEAYMRRFYTFIKKNRGADFDSGQAARLEVNWWVVHRQLFGQTDNQPLVDSLADLYAVVYGGESARVREAAYYRAQVMIYSDRWVAQGCTPNSPLLDQVEQALIQSYTALAEAVQVGQQPSSVASRTV
jgi:hypothetical protein